MTDQRNTAQPEEAEQCQGLGQESDHAIITQAQVYVCPFTHLETTPLRTRYEGALLWFECDSCEHYWDGERRHEWHPVFDATTRSIYKQLLDGSYSAALRILRPVVIDIAAVLARRDEEVTL